MGRKKRGFAKLQTIKGVESGITHRLLTEKHGATGRRHFTKEHKGELAGSPHELSS